MKVLSVKQPWADAILRMGKDVENRTWSTDYRGKIYLHTSKTIDYDATPLLFGVGPLTLGKILGHVTLTDVVRNSSSRWAMSGQYHWIIESPVKFKHFIPARGQLGLWTPSDELIKKIEYEETLIDLDF